MSLKIERMAMPVQEPEQDDFVVIFLAFTGVWAVPANPGTITIDLNSVFLVQSGGLEIYNSTMWQWARTSLSSR